MIIKFKATDDLEISRKDGYVTLSFDDYRNICHLEEAVLFPIFQEDFLNYVTAMCNSEDDLPYFDDDSELWQKLFDMYMSKMNQDDSEWTTLGNVYQEALSSNHLHRICSECGCDIFTMHPHLDIHGEAYCDECIERHTHECHICGKEFPLKELKTFNLKKYICKDCAENGLLRGDFVIVDRHSFDC